MISTVILPVVFSLVLSMISQWPTQVFSVLENKKVKNTANKQTFHGHSSFALFLPLARAKLILKFSPLFSFPHIYIRTMNIYNNEQWGMSIKHVVINRINFLRNGTQPFPKFRRNTHLMGSNWPISSWWYALSRSSGPPQFNRWGTWFTRFNSFSFDRRDSVIIKCTLPIQQRWRLFNV